MPHNEGLEVEGIVVNQFQARASLPQQMLDELIAEGLAVELDRWRLDSRTVNFMVGGPEGLAPEVCARADQRWSLSPLTLPHPLVRILIGEQLYRAWTVLSGHPYHK